MHSGVGNSGELRIKARQTLGQGKTGQGWVLMGLTVKGEKPRLGEASSFIEELGG